MQYHQFIIDNKIVLDGQNLDFLKREVARIEGENDSGLEYFNESKNYGMSLIEWNLIFELKTKSV